MTPQISNFSGLGTSYRVQIDVLHNLLSREGGSEGQHLLSKGLAPAHTLAAVLQSLFLEFASSNTRTVKNAKRTYTEKDLPRQNDQAEKDLF